MSAAGCCSDGAKGGRKVKVAAVADQDPMGNNIYIYIYTHRNTYYTYKYIFTNL